MMKTETIDVPHFEGYKCLGYRIPNKGEYYLGEDGLQECLSTHDTPWLVYEKLPPKRYVFEETGEKRQASYGEYYLSNDENFMLHPSLKDTVGVYPILRRIDE